MPSPLRQSSFDAGADAATASSDARRARPRRRAAPGFSAVSQSAAVSRLSEEGGGEHGGAPVRRTLIVRRREDHPGRRSPARLRREAARSLDPVSVTVDLRRGGSLRGGVAEAAAVCRRHRVASARVRRPPRAEGDASARRFFRAGPGARRARRRRRRRRRVSHLPAASSTVLELERLFEERYFCPERLADETMGGDSWQCPRWRSSPPFPDGARRRRGRRRERRGHWAPWTRSEAPRGTREHAGAGGTAPRGRVKRIDA